LARNVLCHFTCFIFKSIPAVILQTFFFVTVCQEVSGVGRPCLSPVYASTNYQLPRRMRFLKECLNKKI